MEPSRDSDIDNDTIGSEQNAKEGGVSENIGT